MAAVLVAPHPDPRPALRLVVSSTPRPRVDPNRRPRRLDAATYRRRRTAAALVLVTVVALVWLGAAAVLDPATDAAVLTTAAPVDAAAPSEVAPATAPDASPAVYVVRPGDTVWSIAERLRPEGDVRELVDLLTERAGGSGLQAGQRIALDGLGL